jgi:hypothetical protein
VVSERLIRSVVSLAVFARMVSVSGIALPAADPVS